MQNTYVALDIETTGFNPNIDQIIEIAAIKFKKGKKIATFTELINPEKDIPKMITLITGIKNEDIKNSKKLPEIKENLLNFLEDLPIIGHNIIFDITFLQQKGINIQNPLYDTLKLAKIVLPNISSYSLDTLVRTLKIKNENTHRALSDTKATQELFCILVEKLKHTEKKTLKKIKEIIQKSPLEEKTLINSITPNKKKTKKEKPQQITATQSNKKLEKKHIEIFLNKKGPLAKEIKNYTEREEQKQLLTTIINSLQNQKHLLIESGTGTGKTIAYLLSSIYFAKQNNEKIIISTHTKTLQDQLIKKDIPLIKKAIKNIDKEIDFKATILKGKKNYISISRLENLLKKKTFEESEAIAITKILYWLQTTKTGDLEELNLQDKENYIKSKICFDENLTTYNKTNFLKRAKEKAQKADIIVVNHSLLLQNIIRKTDILPHHNYIIFDEAHNLEQVATETLAINISYQHFINTYKNLHKFLNKEFKEKNYIKLLIQKAIDNTELLFEQIKTLNETFATPDSFKSQNIIDKQTTQTQEWKNIQTQSKIIIEDNENIKNELDKIYKTLDEPLKELKQTINFHSLNTQENSTFLTQAITHDDTYSIKTAPIQIGEKLNTHIINNKKSIILTSATLRTENNFNFLKSQLGITNNFEEKHIKSTFNYDKQVKILIPEDIPKPANEGFFQQTTTAIKNTLQKTKGQTLVLFTSKKALQSTYMKIAQELKNQNIEILAQGITGGRGKIIEHFKSDPKHTIIFGTNSFWEGIDLPKNIIKCLIIQKLPFDPPSDPIITARTKLYKNSFNEFQIPKAILKFKQGFGRLIRTHTDKGTFIILDTRIIQNQYGTKFLKSLPKGIKITLCQTNTIQNHL